MRKFIRGAITIFALFALVMTSSAGSVAVAADTLLVHANEHEEETVSLLYVSEEELAGGEVLLVTAEMLDETGNLIIGSGDWNKIVITRNANAKKILLEAVTVKELVIESGSETAYEIKGGKIVKTTVVAPELEVIDYDKLCEMIDSGMESSVVGDALTNYQKEKAYVQEVFPEVKVTDGAELDSVVLMGNAKLDVTRAKVSDVKIDSNGAQEVVKIVLQGYNGALDVQQAPIASGVNNIVNLQLKASEITAFSVNGPEMSVCYMEGDKDSFVTTASVSGGTKFTLDVDATEIRMDEDAENAKVNLYSDVENMVVEGDNNAVRVAACAVIENAVVEGDNVKFGVTGKVNSADVTGTGSEMSYVPKNNTVNKVTPTPTPTPNPAKCNHKEMKTVERIELSEYGVSCGGYLEFQKCACGEYGNRIYPTKCCVEWTRYDITNAGNGVVQCYLECVCQNCGLRMTEERTEKIVDGCKQEQNGTITIYVDGSAAKACEYSMGLAMHNIYTEAELAEGSNTCSDGVVVKSYCNTCKQHLDTWTMTEHYAIETIIDMSVYEGCCGGYISYYKCPCGEEKSLGQLPECNNNAVYEWSNYVDDDGLQHEFATVTCRDCPFNFTTDIVTLNQENCTVADREEYKFYYGEELIDTFAYTSQR